MNFGKYPVLMFNLDTKEGSKARVTSRRGDFTYDCQLKRDFHKEGDGILYLSTNASVIKSHYGVSDHVRSAEYANAPIIEANQEVAVLMYSEAMDVSVVVIVKSGKIDGMCSVATKFENIEE